MGVDENGFTGNIYITDEEVFEKYSKNGIANSKDIQKDMNTILMKDKLLTSAAESHIYTDILKLVCILPIMILVTWYMMSYMDYLSKAN